MFNFAEILRKNSAFSIEIFKNTFKVPTSFEPWICLTTSVVIYIHLTTNTMKCLKNTNEFYYIYYTYVENFRIKKVALEVNISN
jgi:hypothetical protein